LRCVRIVGDCFAICEDDCVIVIVDKCNDTQWRCTKVVPGTFNGVTYAIPLPYAIEEAMKFRESH
jgi:hypothetical protein